ncbi:hypothetical protein [Pseudocitrobacter faecalis]
MSRDLFVLTHRLRFSHDAAVTGKNRSQRLHLQLLLSLFGQHFLPA